MALSSANIGTPFQWNNDVNQTVYTSDSHIFVANSVQYICIRGADDGDLGGSANALGVPTTSGIAWTKIAHASRGVGVVALYQGVITDEVIGQTTITYPAQQYNCAICIVGVTNAEDTVIQSKTGSWDATSGSITLDSAIAAGNLALSFVSSCAATYSRDYTAGTNETALTGLTSEQTFAQYNFADDEVLDFGTPDSGDYGAVGVEIEEIAVVPDEDTVTMCTLYFTDDGDPTGNPVICESALGFEVGMTAELWPADVEGNAITATLIEAIDTAPTATPRYNITFSAAVASGTDTIHMTYVAGGATGGDIKSSTGGIALADDTYDGTTAMAC